MITPMLFRGAAARRHCLSHLSRTRKLASIPVVIARFYSQTQDIQHHPHVENTRNIGIIAHVDAVRYRLTSHQHHITLTLPIG